MPLVVDRKARAISTLAATMWTMLGGMRVIQVNRPIQWGRNSPMSWDCMT
jgi:hypothetical protein